MERLDEITKELREHYDIMREVKYKIRMLEDEEDKIYTERMKKLINICFIGKGGNYYCVLDTPQIPYTMVPSRPNFHQIPVYEINLKTNEITKENYFSAAYKSENPIEELIKEGEKEISKKDFLDKAREVIEKSLFKEGYF